MRRSVKCTPLCPFRAFYCAKRSLSIRKGRGRLNAWCSWIGDTCIGYRCQFATCTRHALLPDGTCKFLAGEPRRRRVSIEEEALKMEREMIGIRNKLKKLGLELDELE